jgi:hypothetical protein
MKTLSQVRHELKGGHDGHKSASPDHTEEKAFVPYFVPMGRAPDADTIKCGGKDVPVHTTDVIRRGDYLWENMDSTMRNGTFGAVYKAYLLASLFFVLTIVTAFFNPYVAGVCAYLAGHFWSERMFNSAWGIEWYKGKNLVYTV